MPRISGVYIIKSNETGKVYVGSSCNAMNRMSQHRALLESGKHHSDDLISEWRKFGRDLFSFEVLEVCARKNLRVREMFYISKYDSMNPLRGFNKKIPGNHGDEPPHHLINPKFMAFLGKNEFKVFMVLAMKMDRENVMLLLPPDREVMADACSMTLQTFSNKIRSLTKSGVLKKVAYCQYILDRSLVRWGTYVEMDALSIYAHIIGEEYQAEVAA